MKKIKKAKKEEPKRVKRVKRVTPVKKEKYFEGLGRRKTAIARVRLFPQMLRDKSLLNLRLRGTEARQEKSLSKSSSPSLQKTEAQFLINEKPLENYFPTIELQQTILAPLTLMNCLEQFKVSVKVKGGGTTSQAEAVRHGVARALVLFNPDFRKKLKKVGYLKRDPRMRERKKFGLKRARRAPQWSKR